MNTFKIYRHILCHSSSWRKYLLVLIVSMNLISHHLERCRNEGYTNENNLRDNLISWYRDNKDCYIILVFFYLLHGYIKYVQSSHKRYFSRIYLCIQSNTTNENSAYSLYSLQQVPAEFYGHRHVVTQFSQKWMYIRWKPLLFKQWVP